YFTYTDFYRPGGPLFFYVGNEGPVEIYVNHTGLMWELGSDLGAMLVFAEHRYYGKSSVYPDGTTDCLRYLTIEQALADYSVLIAHLFTKYSLPPSTATIAFGGSYGGMLASAFRYKYPHLVDGAIAASAPIFAIGGVTPEPNKASFNEIITRDAGEVCAKEFKATLKLIMRLGETPEGQEMLRTELKWCSDATTTHTSDLASGMLDWASAPWGYLAMGNFPYPSNYITAAMNVGGGADLPANPIRAACKAFEDPLATDQARLQALAKSLAIYYNASGELVCNSFAGTDGGGEPLPKGSCRGDYGFQTCTEMPWGQDSGTDKDMFWPPRKFDFDEYKKECMEKYKTSVKAWAGLQFLNNMADAVASMSNVVFSNGKFDPWGVSVGNGEVPQGVDCSIMPCPSSVVSPIMSTGAHHSDLMFSREEDSGDVRACRELEASHIRKWVAEKRERHDKLAIKDSAKFRVIDAKYPALIEYPVGDPIAGQLLADLSTEDLELLLEYEGHEYRVAEAQVDGGSLGVIKANVFVWKDSLKLRLHLDGPPWDYAEWHSTGLQNSLAEARNALEQYRQEKSERISQVTDKIESASTSFEPPFATDEDSLLIARVALAGDDNT
ncbi:hypothetical protein FOL47_004658, partial [Perkinsus chesapeaki]